jgi:hypothetical protein
MNGSGSGGGKGFGHRYLGPDHVLLGILVQGQSQAAQLLRSHGVEVTAARAALGRLAARRVAPAPRPIEAQLLGALGIELDAVRRDSEQTFGVRAVGAATWRVTRRRGWWGRRVVWTPPCGPPLFARRALQLASDQAHALGHDEVCPEQLLLGVLEDAGQPAATGRGPRRHRRIAAHVGLPEGYRGPAGLLLATLQVDLEQLRRVVTLQLGGVRR